jgi:hypothetical protein
MRIYIHTLPADIKLLQPLQASKMPHFRRRIQQIETYVQSDKILKRRKRATFLPYSGPARACAIVNQNALEIVSFAQMLRAYILLNGPRV